MSGEDSPEAPHKTATNQRVGGQERGKRRGGHISGRPKAYAALLKHQRQHIVTDARTSTVLHHHANRLHNVQEKSAAALGCLRLVAVGRLAEGADEAAPQAFAGVAPHVLAEAPNNILQDKCGDGIATLAAHVLLHNLQPLGDNLRRARVHHVANMLHGLGEDASDALL